MRRRNGFTLVELAVAGAVAGILLGAAVPALRKGYRRFESERAMTALLEWTAEARRLSVQQGATHRLSLDPATGAADLTVWVPGRGEFAAVSGRAGRARRLAPGLDVRAEEPAVLFYPDGSSTRNIWILYRAGERVGGVRMDPFSGEAGFDADS